MICEIMEICCDNLLMFLHEWFKAVHSIVSWEILTFGAWWSMSVLLQVLEGRSSPKNSIQTETSFYSFFKKRSKAAKDCIIHFCVKGGFSAFWLRSASEEEYKFYAYSCCLCYLCLPCEETMHFSMRVC